MVEAQGSNAGGYRLRHYVGTVVCASDADLENGSINLPERSTDIHD